MAKGIDFGIHFFTNIVRQFQIHDEIEDVIPFGNGHINDTFIVKTRTKGKSYILQRKNHLIFKDIEGMMENIVRLTSHIKAKLENLGTEDIQRKVIFHYPAINKKYYWKDENGNYWTLFNYISDSISYEKIDNPDQAFDTGKTFGHFQNLIADIDGKSIHETIVNFHNIYFRLENFNNAIIADSAGRLSAVKNWVEELLDLAEEMKILQRLLDQKVLPLRITHNDTKINNILFDAKTGEALCVIDLDTVMPGLVHFDFGDAMRTGASSVLEDEKDLTLVDFKLHVFENFTAGFLSETRKILSDIEKKLLAHAVKFMTYIMALRFMTDYLQGDVYYKIIYPEHNLDRSKNQLALICKINGKMREMQDIVVKYS